MSDELTRRLIGVEDINFAEGGLEAEETFTFVTNDNKIITLRKVDASHLKFETAQDGISSSVEDLVNGAYSVNVKAKTLALPSTGDITTEIGYIANLTGDAQAQIDALSGGNLSLTGYSQLRVYNNATTPNTKIDITAEVIAVAYGAATLQLSSVSRTIDASATGADGLDTGTLAASTWYYIYVIGKADRTAAGVLSLSATSPTMPANYTYKKLVGAVYCDGSTHFLRFDQWNTKVRYRASFVHLTDGQATSPTSITLGGIPPNIVSSVLIDVGLLDAATGWTTAYLSNNNSTNLYGMSVFSVVGSYGHADGQYEIPIITSQIIYYYTTNAGKFSVALTGFDLFI